MIYEENYVGLIQVKTRDKVSGILLENKIYFIPMESSILTILLRFFVNLCDFVHIFLSM
jgi:hypothetical protein